ncbi:serine/arginine repetitive matrix protein 1-like [Schistocerca serialis cubense]|uniref:serine/arginine repetitive matrix protein 1-like n=1 Tax=Schistocerca serialis cubense TaxID=2023355 RepID=UPI00214EB38C|nr:serine/arginine repetitive matrix protein 1-like [Schistocerca serialis cubense]
MAIWRAEASRTAARGRTQTSDGAAPPPTPRLMSSQIGRPARYRRVASRRHTRPNLASSCPGTRYSVAVEWNGSEWSGKQAVGDGRRRCRRRRCRPGQMKTLAGGGWRPRRTASDAHLGLINAPCSAPYPGRPRAIGHRGPRCSALTRHDADSPALSRLAVITRQQQMGRRQVAGRGGGCAHSGRRRCNLPLGDLQLLARSTTGKSAEGERCRRRAYRQYGGGGGAALAGVDSEPGTAGCTVAPRLYTSTPSPPPPPSTTPSRPVNRQIAQTSGGRRSQPALRVARQDTPAALTTISTRPLRLRPAALLPYLSGARSPRGPRRPAGQSRCFCLPETWLRVCPPQQGLEPYDNPPPRLFCRGTNPRDGATKHSPSPAAASLLADLPSRIRTP